MARPSEINSLLRVERAAATLSPRHRRVLMLSAATKLSNEEIAAELGLDLVQVEQLLAEALAAFDRALHDTGGAPAPEG